MSSCLASSSYACPHHSDASLVLHQKAEETWAQAIETAERLLSTEALLRPDFIDLKRRVDAVAASALNNIANSALKVVPLLYS